MENEEITVKQASERIGRTVKTVRNMIDDGRLKARFVNAPVPYYMVSVASIESYEQKQKESDQAAT